MAIDESSKIEKITKDFKANYYILHGSMEDKRYNTLLKWHEEAKLNEEYFKRLKV